LTKISELNGDLHYFIYCLYRFTDNWTKIIKSWLLDWTSLLWLFSVCRWY
jgi:hypothetical protein